MSFITTMYIFNTSDKSRYCCNLSTGTGRYSKCFKAVNKRTRRRVLGEDEGSGDDAGSGSGSGSGLDFHNEIVDDEDEEEYTGNKSREAVQKSSTWRGAFLKRRKKKKKKKKKNKLAAAGGSEPLVLGKPMPGLGGGDESAKGMMVLD